MSPQNSRFFEWKKMCKNKIYIRTLRYSPTCVFALDAVLSFGHY